MFASSPGQLRVAPNKGNGSPRVANSSRIFDTLKSPGDLAEKLVSQFGLSRV